MSLVLVRALRALSGSTRQLEQGPEAQAASYPSRTGFSCCTWAMLRRLRRLDGPALDGDGSAGKVSGPGASQEGTRSRLPRRIGHRLWCPYALVGDVQNRDLTVRGVHGCRNPAPRGLARGHRGPEQGENMGSVERRIARVPRWVRSPKWGDSPLSILRSMIEKWPRLAITIP